MAKQPKKRKPERKDVPAKVARPAPVTAPKIPWYRRDWFWGLLLALAVVLVYSPVWQAGFIWDDDDHVTANPCVVGPLGLTDIWTTSLANFFPLTLTTFWLEDAIWGVDPLPFHLVNVLLHGAAAVVLWRVLLRLRVPGAWLGAALWALHPVQVESAAWISETKNTESGLFFLLAILFFVRRFQPGDSHSKSGGAWNYAWTLIFTALALASKSSTAFLPVVLCLAAWWLEGRWQWRNLLTVLPVFLMSVAGSALAMGTQTQELAAMADPQWERSWPERLVAAGDAVWFYLGKLIWPHPLSIIYPRWQIDASERMAYLPLLAAGAVLFVLWLKRGSWGRPWFFAFAYFLVALLPGLGLIDNSIFRYSLVFDHFQYLAAMGPLALAGAGLVRLVDSTLPGRQGWQWAPVAGLLLLLGFVSWQRVWVYQNVVTLWTDTLAKNPDCWAAHNNLGAALLQTGKIDEAMAQYQLALATNPRDAEAECNLGVGLYQKGKMDEALTHFQRAADLKPSYADAQNDIGCALLKKGHIEDAIAHFEKALQINSTFVLARNNLINAQAMAKQAQGSNENPR